MTEMIEEIKGLINTVIKCAFYDADMQGWISEEAVAKRNLQDAEAALLARFAQLEKENANLKDFKFGWMDVAGLSQEKADLLRIVDTLKADLSALRAENEARLPRIEDVCCTWEYQEYECKWDGSCGIEWVFTDGDPEENECNFCPKCGKKIVILPQPPEPQL